MQEVAGSNPAVLTIIRKEMIINIKDGESGEFPEGTTIGEVLDSLGVKKKYVGAKINGKLVDFWYPLYEDTEIEPVKTGSDEGLFFVRHTAAHVMAEAVQSLYPDVKVTIGPVIEDGFYYDFDSPATFSPEDLEKIEQKMKEIVERDKPLVRKKIPREDAIELFRNENEDYKVEIINDLPVNEDITIYEQGEWHDLCRGPHAPSTGYVKSFKLTSTAGAYWRGDERNAMLQRIYGTAFWDRKQLKKYLNMLEEAKKRDHRKLGKELDLFSIQESVGPGLILWHPKGSRIRRIIEDYWRDQHELAGYELLYTPHIAKLDLWKTSGHVDFYRENMFSPMQIENLDYQIKPMNCPFHILIYKSQVRSYRDLPLRWAEIGTVYRYERSGVLHGLLRVRGFSQDDAHIFCTPEQIKDEILGVLNLTTTFLKTFGFDDYEIYLSTRPEKFVGEENDWDMATEAIKDALETKGVKYEIDEGGGAFYGPKIDLKINDAIGRSWQCSTVQVDFNLPKRFDMNYIGEDNVRHTPIMIHRAIFGSIERFFGILIEHYAGAFPLWLSPEQVRIATISEEQNDYAEHVYGKLKEKGIRAEKDTRNEKLGYKVREAQLAKVPYLLVIGDNEKRDRTVSPRKHGGENMDSMDLEEFIEYIENENKPYNYGEVH